VVLMKQLSEDAKLYIGTDKRIKAVVGFLFVVVILFVSTSPWRKAPEEKPEEYVSIKVEEFSHTSLMDGFNRNLKEDAEERKFLKEEVMRVSGNIKTEREQLDQNMDKLSERLNSVTDQVDHLAKKIGDSSLRKGILDETLESAGKRTR
jgi:DNA anti-recombination protein RmuC